MDRILVDVHSLQLNKKQMQIVQQALRHHWARCVKDEHELAKLGEGEEANRLGQEARHINAIEHAVSRLVRRGAETFILTEAKHDG
jgi:hypothetical protein